MSYSKYVNDAFDLIKDIKSTSSSNEKLDKIKEISNMENGFQDFIKDVFRFAYEPQYSYFLKSGTPLNEAFLKELNLGIELAEVPQYLKENHIQHKNMFELLNDLKDRNITGNLARLAVSYYLVNLDTCEDKETKLKEMELLNDIIERDLKAGISTSTINKAFDNLIKKQAYMRCSLVSDITKADDWLNPKMGYLISQEKLDGMFVNMNVFNDHSVELISRNGTPFPMEHVAFKELNELIKKSNIDTLHQYHGEILIYDKQSKQILPRQIGNGIMNSVLKGKNNSFIPEQHQVCINLWDNISFELMYDPKSHPIMYKDRLAQLEKNIEKINQVDDGEIKSVLLVETKTYPNIAAANEHFKQKIEEKKEGTIIKLPEMLWADKTSREQMKLKLQFVVELEIVGFTEGTGKNANLFGAFQTKSKDGLLEVDVGSSGLTDELKQHISDNREEYIGKIISVEANDIMFSENKPASLFLPVFKEVREDKSEADSLDEIKNQRENAINIQKQIETLIEKQKNKKTNKLKNN